MGGDRSVVSAGPTPEGIVVGEDGVARCWWGSGDPLYRRYHDTESGSPTLTADVMLGLFSSSC